MRYRGGGSSDRRREDDIERELRDEAARALFIVEDENRFRPQDWAVGSHLAYWIRPEGQLGSGHPSGMEAKVGVGRYEGVFCLENIIHKFIRKQHPLFLNTYSKIHLCLHALK